MAFSLWLCPWAHLCLVAEAGARSALPPTSPLGLAPVHTFFPTPHQLRAWHTLRHGTKLLNRMETRGNLDAPICAGRGGLAAVRR